MTIQEMRQKYAALCDQQAAIPKAALDAGRAMTAEEHAQVKALQTEIDNVDATIKTAEAIEARQAALDQPVTQPWRPSAAQGAPVQEQKLDDGGFKSFAEMANVLRFNPQDSRIRNLVTGDVGIMIPPQFSQELLALAPEEEIIYPRARVIPAGDPPDAPFSVPYLNQGALGALGGMAFAWGGEGVPIGMLADPTILPLTLTPRQVSGYIPVSNKTLANWQASGAFILNLMRMGIRSARDTAFISGGGVGQPLGYLNALATGVIGVARAGAGTIAYLDCVNMLAALLPEALNGAFWVASQSILPTLMTLQDPGLRYMYNAGDASKGIPATLCGLPIKYTGKAPALGVRGDLSLINPLYYLIKQGSGPFLAVSEHADFINNNTLFRLVDNVDGQPWIAAPLTLEDGVTQCSAYVVLNA